MKTDGIFGVTVAEVQGKYHQPFNLFCIGDVHRNAPNCAVEKWHDDLKYMKALASKEPTFFLFTGDLLEYLSSSERRFYVSGGLHESTTSKFEEMCAKDVNMFCRETEFMKDKVIGIYGGNHFLKFSDGTTSDMAIASSLKARYIGCSGYTILSINCGSNHNHVVRIFAHHGTGSGKRVGSSFNGLEDAAAYFSDADICLSEDAELLTVTGFKHIKDIKIGDSVYSSNNGECDLDEVKQIIHKPFEGELINFHNESADFSVTPDHRIMYNFYNQKRKKYGNFRYLKASKFAKFHTANIPLAVHSSKEAIDIPDNIIALCGWIIAEGTIRLHRRTKEIDSFLITQKHKSKVDIIKAILDDSGLKYSSWLKSDGCTVFYIYKESSIILREIISSKNIQKWMFDLSDRQFEILLNAMMLGDGHWCTPLQSGEYYGSDESLIDNLQHMCAIHGYRSSKKFKAGGFKNGCYSLLVCKRDTTPFLNIKDKKTKNVAYSGNVWCISTNNGNFIARQNGKVFVTGNCLMGHNHQLGVTPISSLNCDMGRGGSYRIKAIDRWLGRTGSYLKSYDQDKPSYAIDSMMRPSRLGCLQFIVTPRRKIIDYVEDRWVEIKAVV